MPGEKTSATQPIPSKPPAYDRQGSSIDDLIDVHSTAIKRRPEVSRYDFTPEKEDDETLRATRFKSLAAFS